MSCNNNSDSEKENRKLKRTAIIGGTFNELHQGHKDYVKLAFEYAEEIYIFLSSDDYAQICKSCLVEPYHIRKKYLENYIKEINGFKKYSIYELDSEYSLIHFCLKNEITMAVVSPEYYLLFQRINRIREDEAKPPLLLLVKQRTKTSEGFNITSTLIKNLNHDNRMLNFSYSSDLVIYDTINQFKENHPNTMPK